MPDGRKKDEGRRPSPPVETRWKPGQSGNPGGRPKGRSFAALKRSFLMEVDPDDERGRTRGEVLLEVAFGQAKGGDRQSWVALFDRVEGRPRQHVTVTADRRELIEREVGRMMEEAQALGEIVTREDALLSLSDYYPEAGALLDAPDYSN